MSRSVEVHLRVGLNYHHIHVGNRQLAEHFNMGIHTGLFLDAGQLVTLMACNNELMRSAFGERTWQYLFAEIKDYVTELNDATLLSGSSCYIWEGRDKSTDSVFHRPYMISPHPAQELYNLVNSRHNRFTLNDRTLTYCDVGALLYYFD